MNTRNTIESVIYYLDVDSIKSLALTNKTINEVAKEYVNTYLCLTKNKKQDIDLSTMKWYTQYYELYVDEITRVEVLKWWFNTCKEKGIEFKYTSNAIDHTFENGHLSVLKWWFNICKENDIEFKYTNIATILAYDNDKMIVVDWWFDICKENNIEFVSPWDSDEF